MQDKEDKFKFLDTLVAMEAVELGPEFADCKDSSGQVYSQRPQPWFFRAIIFAMANAEPEMRAAANKV